MKNIFIPLLLFLLCSGCKTTVTDDQFTQAPLEKLVLSEGDTVRVTFPGAPDLNTLQQIRRDGKITLPILGEFKASGLSPSEMEKELLKVYGNQLVTKQVSVSIESGVFPVFVSGAVLRPGKITTDRPITALQAIMEAGGFDPVKADTKSVRVIRNEGGRNRTFTLNIARVLAGKEADPFYLKASDIIFVPEKFSWF